MADDAGIFRIHIEHLNCGIAQAGSDHHVIVGPVRDVTCDTAHNAALAASHGAGKRLIHRQPNRIAIKCHEGLNRGRGEFQSPVRDAITSHGPAHKLITIGINQYLGVRHIRTGNHKPQISRSAARRQRVFGVIDLQHRTVKRMAVLPKLAGDRQDMVKLHLSFLDPERRHLLRGIGKEPDIERILGKFHGRADLLKRCIGMPDMHGADMWRKRGRGMRQMAFVS